MRLNAGSLPSLKQLSPRLRWIACQCYEQLGPVPLLIAALWLLLLIYLCVQLRPALTADTLQLQNIQQQLAIPLPVRLPDTAEPQGALSANQYEQVKALFTILQKHGLQASEGRYQLQQDHNTSPNNRLLLTIPLTGEYRQLQSALGEMTASLPLQFESVDMTRQSPATRQLTMSLRIALSGESS